MKISFFPIVIALNLFPSVSFSQKASVDSLDKNYLNWHNLDYKKNKVAGISLEKSYIELLKDKKPKKKVVVAVIDSGVDVGHEDLKGKIWVNPNEIPGNGIDDDNNGYVDDIHGWNFLGNANGENITNENLEQTRIIRRLGPDFEHISSKDQVPNEQKEDYQLYLACKKVYEQELATHQTRRKNIEVFEKVIVQAEGIISNFLGKESFTTEEVSKINSNREDVAWAKKTLLPLYKEGFTRSLVDELKETHDTYINEYLNLEFEPRKIIGDDIRDINDKYYGNPDVKGGGASHGTLVAGLIAANRHNSIGINGISESVEIMVLRAVPHGDELDKDVALSIIYAVDNGADIINLSFGKDFSPEKSMVDQAIRYAEEKNVLIVHAAGNSATNIDETERYPSKYTLDKHEVQNWINVGASSRKADKNLPAQFSNYGQENVDLFAPGVSVISLYPENRYDMTDGTSFSSPVVAGVAALVLSYYPELTAVELKDVLIKSARPFSKKKVYLPNVTSMEKTKVKFGSLSQTGGIVNAYEALKLAEITVRSKEAASLNKD